jgi:cation diffusion facilitator family transporter
MSTMSPAPNGDASPTAGESRARAIRRVALVAILANALLALGQIAIGLFAHAFSLVADAAHTLSDLVTDFMVLFAARHGTNPADRDHPYGHGRIETITSLLLGSILVMVGVGFLWTSGIRLQSMDAQPVLHPAAFAMAAVTLIAKEILFRFTLAASRKFAAPLLEASAWHARSDAASSLVVAIGIGGSLLGHPFLEPLGAAVVGFLILRMGLKLAWQAGKELIDTGLPENELDRLRRVIAATPGVVGLHELRTRRMANRVLCDAHIQVEARITVSEGHYISDEVSRALRNARGEISEVLVHIDTEDDGPVALAAAGLPDRRAVSEALAALGGSPIRDFQIHYLGHGVEIEVFLASGAEPGEADALKQRTTAWLAAHPHYRKITWYMNYAP